MRCWTPAIMALAAIAAVFAVGRPATANDAQVSTDRILGLVRELGDDTFAVRERATRELTRLGIVSRDALEQVSTGSDAEVRTRARAILTSVSESDFRDRLEAFSADYDGARKQTLPGWDNFSAKFGDHRLARQLFVEMQRSEPSLLQAYAKGGRAASDMVDARCRALLQDLAQTRERPTSLGTVASLLLVGAADDVNVDEQLAAQLYAWLIYQRAFTQNVTGGGWSPILKKLLGAWISKDASPPTTAQNLMIAVQFDLKAEALSVATRALGHESDPAALRPDFNLCDWPVRRQRAR